MRITNFGGACDPVLAEGESHFVHSRDRRDWLRARRNYLTASDMAKVLGVEGDAWDVYADKVANDDFSEVSAWTDPAFWGSALEQPIARIAADHYGWSFHPGGYLLVSRAHPTLAATLDGEALDGSVWCNYEGKTVTIWKREDWDEEAQKLPRRVLVQVQHQLLVTKAPRSLVFALIGGNTPTLITVYPHPELHALFVERGEEFMHRVRERIPPEVSARSGEGIARVYAEDDGTTIDLAQEAVEWTLRDFDLGEQIKGLKLERDELRNRIQAALGFATFGNLPEEVHGRGRWKFSLEERAEHVVAASSSRVLRCVKAEPKPRRRRARR